MSQLDRYMWREILGPAVVSIGFFATLVTLTQLLKGSDSTTGLGIQLREAGWAMVYALPAMLGFLLPVCWLFATLQAIGRLATDGEIVALAAHGISPLQLLRVPLAGGLVLTLLATGISIWGEPWGMAGLRSLLQRSAQRAIAEGIAPGRFHDFGDVMLWAKEGQHAQLKQIVLADRQTPYGWQMITAQQGRVLPSHDPHVLHLLLEDGQATSVQPSTQGSFYYHFQTLWLKLDVGQLLGHKIRYLAPMQALPFSALWQGMSRTDWSASERAFATIVLHRKFAFPMATLVFAALACPLACGIKGAYRVRGLLLSLLFVGLYYYTGRSMELSARQGHMAPWLAVWLPNIMGTLAACWLLPKMVWLRR